MSMIHVKGWSEALYDIPLTFSNCFRNEMKSAHSCTLSNEAKHFSTCCVYFLYLGSLAYAGGTTERSTSAKI